MKKIDLPKINDNIDSIEFWDDIREFLKNPIEVKAMTPKKEDEFVTAQEQTA